MSELTEFTSASIRFGLPFLFSGQAQREFFINESLVLIDSLLHPSIEGLVSSPSDHDDGTWIIAAGAADQWGGKNGYLATCTEGTWTLIQPQIGMRVYDRNAQQFLFYDDGWVRASAPVTPNSGTLVDAELRQAFTELVEALKTVGVFGAT